MRRWKYMCLLLLLAGSPFLLGESCYSQLDVSLSASDPQSCGGNVDPTSFTFENTYDDAETAAVTLGACQSFSLVCDSGCSYSEATVSGMTIRIAPLDIQNRESSYTVVFYADCSGAYPATCQSSSPANDPPDEPATPPDDGIIVIEDGKCVEDTESDCLAEEEVYPPEPEPAPSCTANGQTTSNPSSCCSGYASPYGDDPPTWMCM